MKRNSYIMLMALGIISLLMTGVRAEDIKYSDNWGASGFTLERQLQTGVKVTYSLTGFNLSEEMINGESLQVITAPGIFLPNDAGAPNLPGTGRFIAMPQGATASLKVLATRTETYQNMNVAPAFVIPRDTDKGPLHYEKNMAIYGQDAFYPAQPVMMSEPQKIRGVDVVVLGFTPFQYNPITKELIVYKDIQVEITFTGGNGHFGEDRLRSRWWDPILSDALLNWESLPEIDYSKVVSDGKTLDYEYIILCPNDATFISWANTIKDWRLEQGIRSGVLTTTDVGGNTTTAIENYINNAYNTWTIPPVACLLLADYGSSGNTITCPTYSTTYPCVSDNFYADVTGNMLPDVVFARMTAQNSTHLQTMVTKFINYETSPPTDAAFYNYPITALGWQTERWFQLCSEIVGGYWKYVMGKTPVRINAIYSGTPGSTWSTATNTSTVVNYFGPNGLGYIPSSPSTLGGWSGGTATMINNAINSGAFMLQHRDHGYEQGWGEPAYSSSNISSLTNVNNRLPWVFSINCLTGKYNYSSEVFGEKFHRYTYNGQNSGALGVTCPSETSYSFVNDTYVWGLMDNLWPDFMPAYGSTPVPRGVLPAFGNAAGKYFLYQSSWPYNTSNKDETYYLFHSHGDAFSTVYANVPQSLTVSHASTMPAGTTSFSVSANSGALIALSANGVLLGTATGTGSPVAITIPAQAGGTTVKVVVTKQDYFRYSANVSVLSASYPVNLTVMLEGPYGTSQMNTYLNSMGYLPLSQPYSASPWLYSGTEAVATIPNANVVDWVLVEFRETSGSASTATSATVVEREAAFLLKNGSVVGVDGSSSIILNYPVTQNLYVVIWHRNHLAVMSAVPLVLSGGSYTYNFTTAAANAYGGSNGHKQIATGVWGMVAGDGNSDGTIGTNDKVDVWGAQAGFSGYRNGDFNLSGTVDNVDKVEKWAPNSGRGCQVP
jgi:hypothetical protein